MNTRRTETAAPPNPFVGETVTPDPTFYAYALNLPGTQRPGAVDVLVESTAWHDAVMACQEFCSFVHASMTNRGMGDTFGRGAIDLFYQLQRTVPCAVSVQCYDYIVGITNHPEHLEWLGMTATSVDPSQRGLTS